MDLTTNANTRWAAIFVEELANCGLQAVCLAPGSRSTPLALAFAAHPAIRLYRHLDERSAGFFALGLALATERPVALVCTSGTAAANFHPAIIEAFYSYVPLLVLTADRPPELRGSGANQTIDQIKMFGDHVRWAVDLPTPQDDAPDVVVRHVRTLAARAYAEAGGLVRGPVHLNFPFRKPLEPELAPDAPDATQPPPSLARPFTRFRRGRLLPDDAAIGGIIEAIEGHPRGLIICGPGCPGGAFPAAVAALAETTGFPILADPLSNVRHRPQAAGGLVLGGYNLWLPALGERLPRPELILRFGTVPTSAALASYVAGLAPNFHLHVREDGQWADDQHRTDTYLQADPAAVCEALVAELARRGFQRPPDWATPWMAAEFRAWAALEGALAAGPFTEGAAVARLLAALPPDTALFAGNSLPVRHVDTFDRPAPRPLGVFGNRGASGIDGNVSTALGLAAAGRRVVALLGDITFYHDMNGLLAVGQHRLDDVTFVVINNDGGGIFRRLPITRHDPPFTDLFLTPHGLTFDHAAAMYGLGYRRVQDVAGLDEALAVVFGPDRKGPQLIEIVTDGAADYERQRALLAAVAAALSTEE